MSAINYLSELGGFISSCNTNDEIYYESKLGKRNFKSSIQSFIRLNDQNIKHWVIRVLVSLIVVIVLRYLKISELVSVTFTSLMNGSVKKW